MPDSSILIAHLMGHTANTYLSTTLTELSGVSIKTVLEGVAENLFNPDQYYQQGGDMVRVGGITYAMTRKRRWARGQDMQLSGKPIEADKTYKVTR